MNQTHEEEIAIQFDNDSKAITSVLKAREKGTDSKFEGLDGHLGPEGWLQEVRQLERFAVV